MPKLVWEEILKKTKTLLFKATNREVLVFLIFLALSASFWMIQTLNENYEKEFSIPLRLQNVPDEVVITSELPENIYITLRDKGTVLYSYYLLGNGFRPITVDFTEQPTSRGYVQVSHGDINKSIMAQLQTSSRLISVRPDTLDYYYNRGQRKKVPVYINGTFEAASQRYIAKREIYPDSVTIYASQQILDTLDVAYTVLINYREIEDTLRYSVPLEPVRGAKFIPNTVEGAIYTDIYTEKTVEVPVVGLNFPASMKLRTFPSKVKVTFQIGMNQFKQVEADNFVLTTTYEQVRNSETNTIPLHLKTIPEGVINVRINPSQVEFLIEQISEEEVDD